MQKILGGVLGLVVFSVVAFLVIGASQQLELRVNTPPGVELFIDDKPFVPCKHEDRKKGERCDPAAAVQRHYRWFVNGGKTYQLKALGPRGDAERRVRVEETTVTLEVTLENGQPVFSGGGS